MRMSVWGMCVSGQEPAHLQGIGEWVARLSQQSCCCPTQHFWLCRFGAEAIWRNLKYPPQEEASGVPAPQHPDASLCPPPPAGPHTRHHPNLGSGDCATYLLGKGLSLLRLWVSWKLRMGQNLRRLWIGSGASSSGDRETAGAVLGAETV